MKFGVTMFPNNLGDVAIGARLAEDMGFDYVGVADSQSLARELYVTLGVVASATERVMLGPTVSNPLTRHPAVAASAIASINELSQGRAFLGLGSIFWGWITEKIPPRYALAGVAISVGGASALFVFADSTPEILVYAVLFGFGVGGLLSVPPVGYADYYGRRSLGVIRGVTEPLTTFGQAIGAVAAGIVFDFTESYKFAFIAFAMMGGLATVLVLFARPPRRPGPASDALP